MDFPDLTRFAVFAFDTETTGLNAQAGDHVFGFSISTPDGRDYYWDIRHEPKAVRWFNQAMNSYRGVIVCHNLAFDYIMSHHTDLHFDIKQGFCTSVVACLVNEHEHAYSLDYLASRYTKAKKQGDALYKEMAAVLGGRATKNVQMKQIADAPVEIVAPYAKADTRATLELYFYQQEQIRIQKLNSIVEFERSLTPVLLKSQMHGVRVDIDGAQRAVGKMTQQIEPLQRHLDEMAGFACNPQPSKDMEKLFKPEWRDGKWWANDGTPLRETPAGKFSLDAAALRTMNHPAAKAILHLRSLIKTRDTFLVGHVLESAVDGRVYPSINQAKGETAGTGTGRLSYTTPALQQIPDRDKAVAEIIKSVFLPDEGHVWVDADMASFEVRIFAHLIGTPEIVKAYRENPETDFHQFVADLTGLPRNASYGGEPNAKQLNLCVSGDTEYLSPEGWKRIDQYDGGEVAQWSQDGTIEFVTPSHYHVGESSDMYELPSKWGTLKCTGDHRLPVLSPAGGNYNLKERKVRDMAAVPNRNFSIATSWNSELGAGCDLTDAEIRLLVAFQADGSKGSDGGVSFTFRRPRKIQRIAELLTDAGLEYSESHNTSGHRFGVLRGDLGRTGHHGESHEWHWADKNFDQLRNMNRAQMDIFIEEVRHWDGTTAGLADGSFSYTSKQRDNAEFIQLVAHASGMTASIAADNGCWKAHVSTRPRRSIMSYNIRKVEGTHPVYCFTVPSSFFVARIGDAVHITGNSMIFNQGNGSTAESLGMPWSWESFVPRDSKDGKEITYKKASDAAIDVINQYHRNILGVKELAEGCKSTAESRGYIFTRNGRHLRFPHGHKSYKASGLLIQSTAADENKRNWLLIDEALKGTDAKMLLNTHDSYSMSMPPDEAEKLARRVKRNIEKDRGLRVPLILEVQQAGKTWWDSKSKDRWM